MSAYKLKHNPPLVSIVIPAMNEADNLPHVLPRIPGWVFEIVLVDGHSTDGTPEIARQLKPDIRVIQQAGKGKGNALRIGFAAAKGDIIIAMDADGSTDPEEILAFVALLRTGAEFVKGSRFIQGGGSSDMTIFRRLGNWFLMMVTRMTFGSNFTDLCYGYFAFWSYCLPTLNPDAEGFEVEAMMNVRALTRGLKVAELPSFEARRIYGESHLRAIPDGWRILKLLAREWTSLHSTREARPIPVTGDGSSQESAARGFQAELVYQDDPVYQVDPVYQENNE